MQNNTQPFVYSEEQLMARLRFFIGICLALTLTGIVFVVLYSLIFVTQPLNAIAPIDQKFFELIIPVATFLTGTLSGIMLGGKKEDLPKPPTATPATATPTAPPVIPRPIPTTPMSGGIQPAAAPVAAPPVVAVPPRVAVPPIVKPGE